MRRAKGVSIIALLAILCALLASVAAAQTADTETLGAGETGRVVMRWEEFQKIARWGDGAQTEKTGEEFLIPWKEVQDLFGLEIQGVSTANLKLPWREFKTLLEWSVKEAERKRKEAEAQTEKEGPPPPIPFLISSAEYVAESISTDGALFTAKFKIEVLEKDNWKQIPILPADVAIRSTTLPAGVFLQLLGNQYQLLALESGTLDVEIAFSASITESAGVSQLTFAKLPSSTCLVDVTIPMVDANITVAGAQSKFSKTVDGGTRVVAALPSSVPISITWERAIPKAEAIPPRIYSETRTLISVADGMFLGQAQVNLNILHTATRQVSLNVPPGTSVLDVAGREVRDWRVSNNTLNIQFSKDVIGATPLDIKYETPLSSMTGEAAVPVLTTIGVEREKGHIAVVALTTVEIQGASSDGAHAVDVKTLPSEIMGMTNQPILLAYRYVEPTFTVSLAISKHEDEEVLLTVVDRAHFTVMQTFDGRRITKAVYNVRNNRNQFLRLDMPADVEIWSATVAGKSVQPARDTDGRLLLPLVRSSGAGGLSAFPVELAYYEEGTKPDEKGSGTAHVVLPVCSEPITHLMVSLYLPEEGSYSDITGTLREVEKFTQIGAMKPAVPVDAAVQADQMQQQFVEVRNDVIKAAGSSPIEVQLPITGEVYLLEKVLVVKESQWFEYGFRGLTK